MVVSALALAPLFASPSVAGPAVDYASHGTEAMLTPVTTQRKRPYNQALSQGIEELRAGLAGDRSSLQAAASTLAGVVQHHPKSDAAPRAALLQGRAELALGQLDQARATLLGLTRSAPADPHSAQAFVLLGDLAVADSSPQEAWLHYERAATYLEPAVDSYAHYRAGWAHWELGRTAEALDHMTEALDEPALGGYARQDLNGWTVTLGSLPPDVAARLGDPLAP